MAQDILYVVNIFASSPAELNLITNRLAEPSPELIRLVAKKTHRAYGKTANRLRSVVGFTPWDCPVTYEMGKVRKYHKSMKQVDETLELHLYEVSKEFPTAYFSVGCYESVAGSIPSKGQFRLDVQSVSSNPPACNERFRGL
jgi:hypothetical protein